MKQSPAIFVKVVVEGKPDEVFSFERAEISVGRSRDNDLVLAHGSVAERHLRLVARDDRFIAFDQQTEGGSFVDGQKIMDPVFVRHGNLLTVGAYTLELVDRGPPSETERRFLDAIEKDPRDDDTRAVYCDWLDESGRRDEAEFLRAQLAIKTLAPDNPKFQELSSVMRTLAPKMSPEWRRTVAQAALENCDLQFEIKCPKRWDALAPTASPTERFCDSCKRNVHYASTVADARRLVMAHHCVVVDIAELRYPDDLRAFPAVPNPGMFSPPGPPLPPPPGYFSPPDE